MPFVDDYGQFIRPKTPTPPPPKPPAAPAPPPPPAAAPRPPAPPAPPTWRSVEESTRPTAPLPPPVAPAATPPPAPVMPPAVPPPPTTAASSPPAGALPAASYDPVVAAIQQVQGGLGGVGDDVAQGSAMRSTPRQVTGPGPARSFPGSAPGEDGAPGPATAAAAPPPVTPTGPPNWRNIEESQRPGAQPTAAAPDAGGGQPGSILPDGTIAGSSGGSGPGGRITAAEIQAALDPNVRRTEDGAIDFQPTAQQFDGFVYPGSGVTAYVDDDGTTVFVDPEGNVDMAHPGTNSRWDGSEAAGDKGQYGQPATGKTVSRPPSWEGLNASVPQGGHSEADILAAAIAYGTPRGLVPVYLKDNGQFINGTYQIKFRDANGGSTTEAVPMDGFEGYSFGEGGGGGSDPYSYSNDPDYLEQVARLEKMLQDEIGLTDEEKVKILVEFGDVELAKKILGANHPAIAAVQSNALSWLKQYEDAFTNTLDTTEEDLNKAGLHYGGYRQGTVLPDLAKQKVAGINEAARGVDRNLGVLRDRVLAAKNAKELGLYDAEMAAYNKKVMTAGSVGAPASTPNPTFKPLGTASWSVGPTRQEQRAFATRPGRYRI